MKLLEGRTGRLADLGSGDGRLVSELQLFQKKRHSHVAQKVECRSDSETWGHDLNTWWSLNLSVLCTLVCCSSAVVVFYIVGFDFCRCLRPLLLVSSARGLRLTPF